MRPLPRPQWPRQSAFFAWLPQSSSPHRVPRRIATTSAQHAAPIDVPKLILAPGSPHHNSLPSFLEYAKRTNLGTETAVYIGTHYEYSVSLALMRLGFSLLRIGRKSDAGIDLIGHWVLTPLRDPLPVIIQCKARKGTVGPNHVRELEGSFHKIPADWKTKDVLGLLVTTKKATRGVLEALGHSRWPLGFVLVSNEGLVQQFIWNRAACDRGLEGVGVTVRYTPHALLPDADEVEQSGSRSSKKNKNPGARRDIQLTWMGSPIFPERKDLDKETLKLMRQVALVDEEEPAPVAVEKRPRGRPKGAKAKIVTEPPEPKPRGRPKGVVKHHADKMPFPRGGLIPLVLKNNCGRPKGAKNKPKPFKRGRGRPLGSKNKPKILVDDEQSC